MSNVESCFRSKTGYNQFFYRFCRFCKKWFGSRTRFFSHLQDDHHFETTEAYIESMASLHEVQYGFVIETKFRFSKIYRFSNFFSKIRTQNVWVVIKNFEKYLRNNTTTIRKNRTLMETMPSILPNHFYFFLIKNLEHV